jgi:hypothetical protein
MICRPQYNGKKRIKPFNKPVAKPVYTIGEIAGNYQPPF